MKKIVIVGHPFSGYQQVESLLNTCGMTTALPSRREGFTPLEISSIMAKAHSLKDLKAAGESDIQQITPSPVWHGMALDLMLGNLEQDVWGWADPQAIFMLDYWRDIDPQITFMLVYDRPHSVLTQLSAEEAASITPEELEEHTRSWNAYNAAMLHFFHRNTDRCLLVSSQQVRDSVGTYLKQVRARIEAPWSEQMEQLLAIEFATERNATADNEQNDVERWEVADADSSDDMESVVLERDNRANSDLAFAEDDSDVALAVEQPQLAIADKQSQLAALLPAATQQDPLALFIADSLISQHPHSIQLYEELQAVATLPLIDAGNSQLDPLDAFRAMARQQQALTEAEQQTLKKEKLLERLTQAREVAEQLAREQLLLISQQLDAQKLQSEMSEQRKQELQSQAVALQKLQEESRAENELLLEQLHHVQEELERHYLENQRQADQVEALINAEKQAGEKLDKLNDEYAKTSKKLEELEAASDSTVPAINQTELEQENELLLTQLHHVQEELERFYLENQSLKGKVKQAAEPAYYGAADRVKAQLSYRLGATMIQCSSSLSGWLRMPFALRREARLFKQEAASRATQKLPPISKYRDAHDAERVKLHLSYCLGQAFLTNSHSPIGWMKIPFALRREVAAFKQRNATK